MTKFEIIRLKAEMVSDILNGYSWQINSIPDRIKSLQETIDEKTAEAQTKGEKPDIEYFVRELEEAGMKVKIYDEIVKHLEKLF